MDILVPKSETVVVSGKFEIKRNIASPYYADGAEYTFSFPGGTYVEVQKSPNGYFSVVAHITINKDRAYFRSGLYPTVREALGDIRLRRAAAMDRGLKDILSAIDVQGPEPLSASFPPGTLEKL